MGAMMSKPKAPAIIVPKSAPLAAPTADNSAADLAAAEEKALKEARRRKGRAATILTAPDGMAQQGLGTKALLG